MNVVIIRKDKRVRHKVLHALAFALTGGASGLVTAAEVANHASYNARTRKLNAQARKVEWTEEERAYFAAHVPKQR